MAVILGRKGGGGGGGGAPSGPAGGSLTGTYPNPGIADDTVGALQVNGGDAAAINTKLGLGTGDTPEFTAVSIDAADTTITRAGAGDIAVEGNTVYRAGGTDVALADGGTGASLADPNADRIMFWDDSAGSVAFLEASTGLSISGTVLTALGLVQLFDSELGADAAAIDTGANGIAQTKNHLLFILLLRTTQAIVTSSATLTFNNDTGSNYGTQRITVTNTSLTGGVALSSSNVPFNCFGANAETSSFTPVFFIIPSYRSAVFKNFTALVNVQEDTAADASTEVRSGKWRSTTAISRAAITSGSGNLLAGSRMSIYGL